MKSSTPFVNKSDPISGDSVSQEQTIIVPTTIPRNRVKSIAMFANERHGSAVRK